MNIINNIKEAARICMVLAALLLSACSDTELDSAKVVEGQKFQAELTLYSPEPLPVNVTRGQTAAEENISEMQVLVFVNGLYKYTSFPTSINSSAGVTTLSSYFYVNSSSTTLFFIANGNAILTAKPPKVGDSQATVAGKLTQAFTAAGITNNFAMFGSYTSATGINPAVVPSISGISMMRNMARIDVDATAVSSNFQLASIQAFRANTMAQVIPNSLVANAAVTGPSIPLTSAATVNTTVITPTSSATSSTSQLYLPESVAPSAANQVSQATCIIVGGYYNGSSTLSYYRMDFNPGTSGNPFGQVLRNYQYIFSIKGISVPGFSTPGDAANSVSTGITVQVTDWSQINTNLSFLGSYYFSVSARTVLVGGNVGNITNVAIKTNVPSYTMQWANSSGVGSGTPATSLNNGTFSVIQQSGGTTIQVTALTANTSSTPVTQYVLLTAYGMQILLTINQTNFGVTPSPVIISASGGYGYLITTSTSAWSSISGQPEWMTLTQVSDSLKWAVFPNDAITPRTGSILLTNYSGQQIVVPITQNAQNGTVVNILSINDGQPGQLGTDTGVGNVNNLVQGLKGILVRGLNFSMGGTINMANFKFTATNNPGNLSAALLADIHVLYVGTPSNTVTPTQATVISTWLAGATNRVLVVGMDVNTAQNVVAKFGITSPNYYNVGSGRGNHSMVYNTSTTYFSTTGPFTSYPYKPMAAGVIIRNQEQLYCEINTTTYPSVTKILQGPGGQSVLGVDPVQRVVYVGDQNIFQPAGTGTGLAIPDNTGVITNDATKLVANLWAWITNTALGNQPAL